VKLKFCLLGLLLLVAACAQPARTSQMIYHANEAQLADMPDVVRDGIAIVAVNGGQETDPLWQSEVGAPEFRDALLVSLQEAQLHDFDDNGPFSLTTTLLELEQPLLGFDMTVTCRANYLVIRDDDGAEVFNETIATPYTATVSDAFMGTERLRMANEGAARANIKAFIDQFLAAAQDL